MLVESQTAAEVLTRFGIGFAKRLHLIERGIAHIVDGIVVFALEKLLFKGENGEEHLDVATDVADPPFLPRPNFGGDIIDGGDGQMAAYPRGDAEIETGIVHKNHRVRTTLADGGLALAQSFRQGGQMERYLHKSHKSEGGIMAQQAHTGRFHQIAAETDKFGLRIGLTEGGNEVGGMEVARGFTGNEKIAHGREGGSCEGL